jgi:hypothetical protein
MFIEKKYRHFQKLQWSDIDILWNVVFLQNASEKPNIYRKKISTFSKAPAERYRYFVVI